MRLVTVAFGSGWGQGEGRGWASHALEAPTAVGPLPLTAPSFLALQACPRSTARKSGHYPPEHGTSGIQKHVARSPSSLRPPGAGGGQGAQPARVQLCSPALGNRPGGRLSPWGQAASTPPHFLGRPGIRPLLLTGQGGGLAGWQC